ncbi:formate dehydrogenase accessory sulfurtransferase FdhD [Vibrio mangrovi]|uniref:Sulfur carrier protein FdhD n=1 Tax=Vibrio mangrovi TaxID=474394 RepID=A0A1Y6IXR7_9VIBR|nr:formate dehydrogenase accessory sulfurtransferase FdhD [Vibrio mangrovi]MDW6002025.1 formate dehydrogenase accessory sulfurtransferase FdhD [Vibrio mangrovi]SMS02428.1 formate dehydrogenase accessory protein [Vibrio mangrovi]
MYDSFTVQSIDSVSHKKIVRYRQDTHCRLVDDVIIQEVPVALEYNGIAYTVMMCTPRDLEMFAVGFSLTEGIIDNDRDIHDIGIHMSADGITISIDIANRCLNRLQEKRRTMAGMTGCGLCGTDQLTHVCRVQTPLESHTTFHLHKLDGALHQLNQNQQLNKLTGSCHAAAYLNPHGELEAVFEDVGRHIALDKLIGWTIRNHKQKGAVLVTSRASFEMVQKVAAGRIEMLFAVSAATDMAIDLAERLNVTLCGYCRPGQANIYTHAERILGLNE